MKVDPVTNDKSPSVLLTGGNKTSAGSAFERSMDTTTLTNETTTPPSESVVLRCYKSTSGTEY